MSQIELRVDGVVVYASGAVAPAPIPAPPPVLTPPHGPLPVTPPSGTWPLHETQLWPIPPLRGVVISVPFVADVARFPNGVEIKGVDESNGPAKDYVISEYPGVFEPVGGSPNGVKLGAGSIMGPIYCRFGPARPRLFFGAPLPSIDLSLTPNGVYYINSRAADGSGSIISTQFVCTARID